MPEAARQLVIKRYEVEEAIENNKSFEAIIKSKDKITKDEVEEETETESGCLSD